MRGIFLTLLSKWRTGISWSLSFASLYYYYFFFFQLWLFSTLVSDSTGETRERGREIQPQADLHVIANLLRGDMIPRHQDRWLTPGSLLNTYTLKYIVLSHSEAITKDGRYCGWNTRKVSWVSSAILNLQHIVLSVTLGNPSRAWSIGAAPDKAARWWLRGCRRSPLLRWQSWVNTFLTPFSSCCLHKGLCMWNHLL